MRGNNNVILSLVLLITTIIIQSQSLLGSANFVFIDKIMVDMNEDVNITVSETNCSDMLLEKVICYGEATIATDFFRFGDYEGPLPATFYMGWDYLHMKKVNETVLIEYPENAHNSTRGGPAYVFDKPFYGYVPINGSIQLYIGDLLCNITAMLKDRECYNISFEWLPSPFSFHFPLPEGSRNIHAWVDGDEMNYTYIQNKYKVMKNFSLIEVNAIIYPPYRGTLEILVEYDAFLESHNNEFRLTYASATWELNWRINNWVYMHIHFPQNTMLLSNQSEGFTGWSNESWDDQENPMLECRKSGSWLLKNNLNITFARESKDAHNDISEVTVPAFNQLEFFGMIAFVPLVLIRILRGKHNKYRK